MAITSSKDRVFKITPDKYFASYVTAEAIVAGALVTITAAGTVKNAAAADGYACIGVAHKATALGAKVEVFQGIWEVSSADVGADDIEKDVYIVDNDAVTLTVGTTFAGVVKSVEGGRVFIKIGK